jgi:hypothetical protein
MTPGLNGLTIRETDDRFKEVEMFKPVVLTEGALIRILRRYSKHLGISDLMSDATSQLFLRVDQGVGNWDRWLRTNCGQCTQSPEACRFFHPTEDQCHGDLTPVKLQMAQMSLIDLGRISDCPIREDQ